MELRYVDPRRFGVFVAYRPGEVERSPELSVLGLDPLGDEFTPAALAGAMEGCGRAIKDFLLDQSRVAGLGNIYAAEALFHAGISPRRRANQVGPVRTARLHAAVRDVLLRGVENRGTSLRDYVDAEGASGGNQHHLAVYGREGEPCRTCGTVVRRLVQGARSTFYCPACQR
jgi:formamidopyrimidine-DNA glycosylase